MPLRTRFSTLIAHLIIILILITNTSMAHFRPHVNEKSPESIPRQQKGCRSAQEPAAAVRVDWPGRLLHLPAFQVPLLRVGQLVNADASASSM